MTRCSWLGLAALLLTSACADPSPPSPERETMLKSLDPVRVCPNGVQLFVVDGRVATLTEDHLSQRRVSLYFAEGVTPQEAC